MADNKQEIIENTGLIAISKTLARAKDGMTMQERKLASIFLSKIEWKNLNNNLEIWIDKGEIARLLGSKMDSSDFSPYLRKLAQGTVHHSELHFDGETDAEWEDMPLFTRRKSTRNKLMMEVYSGAAKLLEGLECDYITLFLSDILNFSSNTDGLRAYRLYEFLRLHSDTRRMNTRIISTKEFKELFDIPKDGEGSYMQFDKKKGKNVFNRTRFEERVIEPALEMVAECNHVVLHNYGKANGKTAYYQKIKKHGMVQGYEVTYSINRYPNAIKRETIIDIQAKPEVLKVAQDIMDSKKKTGSKTKTKDKFNNFEQRKYSNRYYELFEKIQNGNATDEERAEYDAEKRKASGLVVKEKVPKVKEMTPEQIQEYEKQTENSKQMDISDFLKPEEPKTPENIFDMLTEKQKEEIYEWIRANNTNPLK